MKTAVVYYSLGGSTRSFARAEAQANGADLFEVEPAQPYTLFTAFLRGCPAAIRQQAVPLRQSPDLSGYDRVILLSPIWANHPAPPFNSAAALLPAGAAVEVVLVSGSGKSGTHGKVRALIERQGCTLTALRDVRPHR